MNKHESEGAGDTGGYLMEEQAADAVAVKREFVTGRELRDWLDLLTLEELERAVLVTLGGSDTQYVLVDFCHVITSGSTPAN